MGLPDISPGQIDTSKPRRLLKGRPGYFMFDSLAVDANGDVCVATLLDGGITTLSAADAPPAFVPMPDRITTNICFGGADLKTAYITLSSSGQLVSMDWPVGGLPLNFLNQGKADREKRFKSILGRVFSGTESAVSG